MIRAVEPLEDGAALIRLTRQMAKEGPYADIEFDGMTTARTIADCVRSGFARVATNGGDELVGFALCTIGCYTFSKEKLASDYAFYVTPEERGHMHGIRLLKAYIQWAQDEGAVEITIGASHGFELGDKYPERLAGIVEKLGFKPSGSWFKMKL